MNVGVSQNGSTCTCNSAHVQGHTYVSLDCSLLLSRFAKKCFGLRHVYTILWTYTMWSHYTAVSLAYTHLPLYVVLPTINFVLSSESALTYVQINVLLSNFNPMGRDFYGESTTLVSGHIDIDKQWGRHLCKNVPHKYIFNKLTLKGYLCCVVQQVTMYYHTHANYRSQWGSLAAALSL